MKFLSYEQIVSAVNNCVNGRIIRIGYCKPLNLYKQYEDKGFRAYKITETTVRIGVNYNNIASVKARKLLQEESNSVKRNYANNFTWIIPNKVKYNGVKDKHYLQVATFNKGNNTKSQYLVYDAVNNKWDIFESNEWKTSEYYEMVTKESKRIREETPEVYTISFDNIYRIGDLFA